MPSGQGRQKIILKTNVEIVGILFFQGNKFFGKEKNLSILKHVPLTFFKFN